MSQLLVQYCITFNFQPLNSFCFVPTKISPFWSFFWPFSPLFVTNFKFLRHFTYQNRSKLVIFSSVYTWSLIGHFPIFSRFIDVFKSKDPPKNWKIIFFYFHIFFKKNIFNVFLNTFGEKSMKMEKKSLKWHFSSFFSLNYLFLIISDIFLIFLWFSYIFTYYCQKWSKSINFGLTCYNWVRYYLNFHFLFKIYA